VKRAKMKKNSASSALRLITLVISFIQFLACSGESSLSKGEASDPGMETNQTRLELVTFLSSRSFGTIVGQEPSCNIIHPSAFASEGLCEVTIAFTNRRADSARLENLKIDLQDVTNGVSLSGAGSDFQEIQGRSQAVFNTNRIWRSFYKDESDEIVMTSKIGNEWGFPVRLQATEPEE
jgi:hypothetical protein